MFLYPYREGQPVPRTSWADSKHTELNVAIAEEKDTITFTPASSGKTDVLIARDDNGKQTILLNVNQAIQPLKDDSPGPLSARQEVKTPLPRTKAQ